MGLPGLVKILRIVLWEEFDTDIMVVKHPIMECTDQNIPQRVGRAKRTLAALNGHPAAPLAVVDDDHTRRLMPHLHALEILNDLLGLLIGYAHNDDVRIEAQVIHLMFELLTIFLLARIKFYALIGFKQLSKMFLPVVLVSGGKNVFKIVF